MATRKSFSNEFKAKVAMEALKGEMTLAPFSLGFGIWWGEAWAWRTIACRVPYREDPHRAEGPW